MPGITQCMGKEEHKESALRSIGLLQQTRLVAAFS
jgi:hypothetical protein